MYNFLLNVLAVVVGMIVYDAVQAIIARIRVYRYTHNDDNEMEEDWEDSWEEEFARREAMKKKKK